MKTTEEMLEYLDEHNIKEGYSWWRAKHFKVLENNLAPDEEVVVCFIGLNNYHEGQHEGYYAYALTNKRLIMGQKNAFNGETFKYVELNNVNDVTKKTGIISGDIIIDTFKEKVIIDFSYPVAERVFPLVEKFLRNFKNNKFSSSNKGSTSNISTQLKELKTLLDDGIITEEDFNAKKKQLLGL